MTSMRSEILAGPLCVTCDHTEADCARTTPDHFEIHCSQDKDAA